MRNYLTVVLLGILLPSFSQKNDSTAIMDVIQSVFEAMENNDSTLAQVAFTVDASLSTVVQTEEGSATIRTSHVSKLITAFGQPKEVPWTEPIWNPSIQQDGNFAAVWVDYAFYLGNEFSHCGVDAFHLVKTRAGWKIFHLTDTRRKENCSVPEEISARYR